MFYPQVLVLGPGGIKSLLALGALFRLNQEDILSKTHTFIGVSAGSLISLLLVAGYSIEDIVVEAVGEDLLHDVAVINFSASKENMGLIEHTKIRERLCNKIKAKFGKILTLKQLYLATGRSYISVASNLEEEKPHYFSWETDPDLSCVEAALYSMNIPFVFQKLNYKGLTMVDGALTDPCPILYKDDEKTDILAISVSSSRAGEGILKYFNLVIQTPMTRLKEFALSQASPRCKHIDIACPTLDTLGFSLNAKNKSELLILGYKEAEKFLENLG